MTERDHEVRLSKATLEISNGGAEEHIISKDLYRLYSFIF